MTRAERVILFIETYCFVPEGKLVGQPMKLDEFQKLFIRAIYDADVHVALAILSIARKNGKTGLIAAILLAHLCGPEAVLNSQIVSGAMSRDQAALVFNLAVKMIYLNPELVEATRIVPSSKRIYGLEMNVEYRALAADGTRAHGLSPLLAILDEVGQVRGPSSDFVDAITTAQGAYDDARQIVISTQAPSDADMLSMWIDDAIMSEDPSIVCHVYAADEECGLLDREQWAKANPALGNFRSEADLQRQMEKAERLPTEESKARNLILNQRISQESLFITPKVWKMNDVHADIDVLRKADKVAMGLDLSARNDLTAAVIAARDEHGYIHAIPFVFCPSDGIEARSDRDRAPYDVWVKEGKMFAVGGASMDYAQIAEFLRDILEELSVTVTDIVFDRWRMDIFKSRCEDLGAFPWAEWHSFGQGFKDQSPSLECLQSLILEKKLAHGNHPLLNMAASNAIVVKDPAGSIKIDKSKSTQRIDPLIALHQAVYHVSEGVQEENFDVSAMIG